jgi:hypothetical protein
MCTLRGDKPPKIRTYPGLVRKRFLTWAIRLAKGSRCFSAYALNLCLVVSFLWPHGYHSILSMTDTKVSGAAPPARCPA